MSIFSKSTSSATSNWTAGARKCNEAFTGWSRTFTDPRLCAAIVDRLTFNATIIETGTESYRLARTKAQRNDETKYTITVPRSN